MATPSIVTDLNTERTPLLSQSNTQSSTASPNISSNKASNNATLQHGSNHPNPQLDEESTIPEVRTAQLKANSAPIGRIVCVLLIGSFISSADVTLLIATHPIIASEFNALNDASWLLTSFALAQASFQPFYGKLSDIYGRKSLLIVAYTLFAIGVAFVGLGTSMPVLILGRVISGAGASGMTALASILITDLVPIRDVASWRSYVNVAATTGRSIGGPVGGWLADTVGWRWSFLGQVPLACIAAIFIGIVLPSQSTQQTNGDEKRSRLARIDFIGAAFMTLTILSLLTPLEIGGNRVAWSSPIVFALLAGAVVLGAMLLVTEKYWAKEPILPLSLLRHRDVMNSNMIMFCQCVAQTGVMVSVPLYFQITSNASNTVAGAHLIPAVVGNATGGILSGAIINRTGRYKPLIIIATLVASSGYLLLILRWHGNTNWLESLYIFPGGFGMGIAQSAVFISIQAAIDPSHMAIATSNLYLTSHIGTTAGMAGVNAILQSTLRSGLKERLIKLGFEGTAMRKIIKHAVSDIHYADNASPSIAEAVTRSYIVALMWTHGMFFPLICSHD